MKKNYKQYSTSTQPSYLSTLIAQKQYLITIDYLLRDYFLRWLYLVLSLTYHKMKKRSFFFLHNKMKYNINKYNLSWGCERAIEIPITKRYLKDKTKILEVGNVLSHYYPSDWKIIDKFEKEKGVTNIDLFDYNPKDEFDLIVSISTLEHIGIDDSVANKELGLKAIEKLKTLLKKDGEMLVTIPVGYNPILDKAFIKKGTFDQVYAMKRVAIWNTWKQVTPKQVINTKYGWPYNNANAILVGYFKKPSNE